MQHASKLGLDLVMGAIVADNDWWELEIVKYAGAAKFRTAGLDSEEKMRLIFYEHSVTNEHVRVPPTVTVPPTGAAPLVNIDEEDDDLRCDGKCFDTPHVVAKSVKKRTTGYSPSPGTSKKRTENKTSSCMHRLLDIHERKV